MKVAFTGLKEQTARLRAEIDARIAAVIDHGQFVMGPEVFELEGRLKTFSGAQEVVTVANGTDALQIALMAGNVGFGDLVFIPSFTFTATAEVVILLGATPVFVDVDPNTFNIDCDDLEKALKEFGSDRAKAVIAVDLFGLPADWTRLNRIAKRNNLMLIDDAAQSFGASLNGRRVGTLAPVTTTSFFPAKPLGCFGDGGAILTDDPGFAEIMRSIRSHGQGSEKYSTVRVGVNSRLDTMQAAVLLAKLDILNDEIARREKIANIYSEQLSQLVCTPPSFPGSVSAWAQYTIATDDRDVIRQYLASKDIPTAVYYPMPMHLQPAYIDRTLSRPLRVSERICSKVLSLPLNTYSAESEIIYVCESIQAALCDRGK